MVAQFLGASPVNCSPLNVSGEVSLWGQRIDSKRLNQVLLLVCALLILKLIRRLI